MKVKINKRDLEGAYLSEIKDRQWNLIPDKLIVEATPVEGTERLKENVRDWGRDNEEKKCKHSKISVDRLGKYCGDCGISLNEKPAKIGKFKFDAKIVEIFHDKSFIPVLEKINEIIDHLNE